MKGIEYERIGGLRVWTWALLMSVTIFGLYLLTLAPSTAFWDTSEYIATARIMGLPHPPGNPLFVLLGRVWILLLGWTGLEVAARINVLSAFMSAAAAFFWFLTVMRIWAHFSPRRSIALVAAALAVLLSATAFTVWTQSNVNEKVYTVSILFVALISYLAMVWEDHSDTFRGDRLIILVAFLLGLGATNHQMSLMPIIALGVFLLWHSWRTLLRWKLVTAALAFAWVGFSVQLLFVPIRSAQNPIIDEADPECPSLASMVMPGTYQTIQGATKVSVQCDALAASLLREQYQKPPLSTRQSPPKAQLAMYRQYFDWQWARSLAPGGRMFVTLLFMTLGIIGLARHRSGDRDSFVYFFTLLLTTTVVLVVYLNFKYGYSQYPRIPPLQHEVRERDYFFVLSFNVWGLYAGMGLVTVWQWLAERVGSTEKTGTRRAAPSLSALRVASPVLGLALLPLLLNFSLADRRGDYAARDWAYNLLQSVEPYGVLFTNGDNDTFPLWYLQEVEGIRRDVTVIVHSYLGTKWYPKQLRELTSPCPEGVDPLADDTVVICQRPFDTENAVEPYRGRDFPAPTRAITDLSDEQIDGIPAYQQLQAGVPVPITEALQITFPSDRIVTHPDIIAILIARYSLGDRPVYFASTAPPVYKAWNLDPYLMRQGLALKLMDGEPESTVNHVRLDGRYGGLWLDLERTRTLLWDVFQLEYLLDWDLWPDPSTRASIPAQYSLAHLVLGDALTLREETELAERSYERGEQLYRLTARTVP
ncbi:MAG: DUF2723 domain-containing protein [Gemmatimonadota bacterium]